MSFTIDIRSIYCGDSYLSRATHIYCGCLDSLWRFPNSQVSQSVQEGVLWIHTFVKVSPSLSCFSSATLMLWLLLMQMPPFSTRPSYLAFHSEQSPPATTAALMLSSVTLQCKLRGGLYYHASGPSSSSQLLLLLEC